MFLAHHQSHPGSQSLLGTALVPAAAGRPGSWVHCMCSPLGFWRGLAGGVSVFLSLLSSAHWRQSSEQFMLQCQPTHKRTCPWGRWLVDFPPVPWECQWIWCHCIMLIKFLKYDIIKIDLHLSELGLLVRMRAEELERVCKMRRERLGSYRLLTLCRLASGECKQRNKAEERTVWHYITFSPSSFI